MGTVRLCGVADLAAGTARRFDVAGHRIALVRVGDEFYALGDRCSHADYSLSEGEVWADECELECPKHGSTFDLRTGEPQSLPATKPVPVYAVAVQGDDVVVLLDDDSGAREQERRTSRGATPGTPASSERDREQEQRP